jgi:uncharacterized membrane protein
MGTFSGLDITALAFFATAWLGYGLAMERAVTSKRNLNALMNDKRQAWMERMVMRENRIVDTTIMVSLQNGTAFFASTSLLAVGGVLALMQSPDALLNLFGRMIADPAARRAWELKGIGLAVIFVYAFFKFAWSYRLFNYGAILIGAVPPWTEAERPETSVAARRAAAMNAVAGQHFNRGQRAYFFALAYLGWFVGPWAFMAATAAVLLVMWQRQFASDARAAVLIED